MTGNMEKESLTYLSLLPLQQVEECYSSSEDLDYYEEHPASSNPAAAETSKTFQKVDYVNQVPFDIHELEWTFLQTLSQDFFCSLCKKLLKEPLLTECCGVHLCRMCAEPFTVFTAARTELSQCPSCSQQKVKTMLNKSKWKIILGLNVCCPMKEQGCTWKGEIRDYSQHRYDCPYMIIECSNECGENLKRCQEGEHLLELCPKRLVKCQHCGETGKFLDIINDCGHLLVCPEYQIVCPHGCGKEFKQVKFDEHMDTCPDFKIPCDFRFAGCNVLIERKQMPQHLLENFEHHLKQHSMTVSSSLEKNNELFQHYTEEIQKKAHEYASRDCLENECQQLEAIRNKTEVEQNKIKERMDEIHGNHEHTIKALHNKHTTKSLWELDRKQLQLRFRITSGSLTEVWEGLEFGHKKVAIKQQKHSATTASIFLKEAYLMRQLSHRNILQLCGVSTVERPFLIVTEYMTHGNLLGFIRNKGKTLTKVEQIDIIRQVASGMAYLEELKCIHRALTSRSILVGNELRCKISSFTQAHMLDKNEREYKIPQGASMPIKWSAPEVLNENKCSTKSDVWSFGILQYEVMSCGGVKIPNTRVEDLINLGDKLEIPPGCSYELYRIMERCWSYEPDNRPSFCLLVDLYEKL